MNNVFFCGIHTFCGLSTILENRFTIIYLKLSNFQANNDKVLSQLGIVDGSLLKCDDFLQNYELTVAVSQYVPEVKDDPPFKVVANPEELKAKEEKNGKENGSSTSNNEPESDEDDLMVVDGPVEDPQEGSSRKKRKIENDSDDDIVEVPL